MSPQLLSPELPASHVPKIASRGHIGFFDGLRGALSLWVFSYHAAVIAGFHTRLIPRGAVAVDLFMFISGFLMAYTLSIEKSGQSSLSSDRILAFYIRRFFRIIPVYYVALLFAVMFYATLLHYSDEATIAFPPVWATEIGNDPSIKSVTFFNILFHMTMLYGLNPHYASNLPIPDWTLSLEAQFYLVVPFLLMSLRKYGLTLIMVGLAIVNFLTFRYVGLYLEPKALGFWPQPAFIIFKLDCFLIGILIAFYFVNDKFNKVEILSLLIVLVCLEDSFIFAVTITLCFIFLKIDDVGNGFFGRAARYILRMLQTKVITFFGEISYDFYLAHLPVSLVISHFLLKTTWYIGSPSPVRFAILIGLAAMIVVPVSYLLHITVESWGQSAARPISKWVLNRNKPIEARA